MTGMVQKSNGPPDVPGHSVTPTFGIDGRGRSLHPQGTAARYNGRAKHQDSGQYRVLFFATILLVISETLSRKIGVCQKLSPPTPTPTNSHFRSDTAGYQHELLKYCEKGKDERFGRIEFAIGCDVTLEFKKAVREVETSDWQPIYKEFDGHRMKTNQEWAEVCFIPAAIGYSKNAPVYRYMAIREVMGSIELPGVESPQQSFPFPTFQINSQRYKLFGLVTNMDWAGEKLIHWHRERCGKSEEAHSVMKEDLAGGKLPSDDFGENAAWWWI